MNGDGKVHLWHGFDLRNLRFLLLRRPPREEIPDRPFPGFAGYDHTVHQLLRGETLRCSITEETSRTWPAPLSFEEQVVEVVVDIDKKTAGKTAHSSFPGAGCGIGDSAQCDCGGEVSSGHHSV